MRGGAAAFFVCVGLTGTADARQQPGADLSSALSNLARQADIELIFDPAQMAGTRVAPKPAASVKVSLDLMLAGTRFTYRQADPHTFVIVGRAGKSVGEARQPAPSAGPEIVVMGSRSQNVDLVRGKDEIQPYWIATADQIASSGAETLDTYLRDRLPLNRNGAPLSQLGASPRSQVDMRGLGPDQTLILVDGRRFAGIPSSPGLFEQSDLNAIPVEAVDRIEVLATSSGGIFGIGATGGVVNIVLKHDYDGALLTADTMTTERGDGIEHRLYGRVGWKSPSGRTRIMASASYAHDGGLVAGDRPFVTEARALRVGYVGYTDGVVSNSLNIRSLTGTPLTFTTANGGASLGSSITYMPVGANALDAAGLAVLKANAGKQDISLASDGQGAAASLVARTTRSSVMATVRQEVGSRSELYLDYLRLDDRGYQQAAGFFSGYNVGSPFFTLAPGAGGNPFNQAIGVSFPTSYPASVSPERDLTQRATAGFIRRFGGGWTLSADGAYSATSLFTANSLYYAATTPRVFAGRSAIDSDIRSPRIVAGTEKSTTHLIDANIRMTGPIASLPGGPATITATGEFRRVWSAGFLYDELVGDPGGTPITDSVVSIPYSENVWSAFGETRLPVLPAEGPARPWRGLSAQVALRLDRYTLIVPPAVLDAVHNQRSVPAFTFGIQSRPVGGLMLRASLSSAATPPMPSQLQSLTTTFNDAFYVDPKRGGLQSFKNASTFQYVSGSTSLTPQRTETLSAGMVVEPEGIPALRLSVDYTKLVMRHQIETFAAGDLQYFLDNEAEYPGHIDRSALTAADQALGYTGGRITKIDAGPLQTGTTHLDALDFALSYSIGIAGGTLHMQADGDWELSYRRFGDPRAGTYDLVGHADGPLAWRANLGLGWSSDRLSIDTQAQLYASYSLADATPPTAVQIAITNLSPAEIMTLQAREPRVPTQAYVDLSIAFRPQGKQGMQIRATIGNLFNRKPPIVANIFPSSATSYVDATPSSGVAYYGDMLGRRFAVNIRVPLRF